MSWVGPMIKIAMMALMLQAEAALPPASQPVGEISDPHWLQTPSREMLQTAYPMTAMRREKFGTATVRCKARADGSLSECVAVCESPGGYGFATAALSLSGSYRLEPKLPDGRSVEGGTVAIPVRFMPPFPVKLERCDKPAGN